MKKEIVVGVVRDLSTGCPQLGEIITRYVYPEAMDDINKMPEEQINVLAKRLVNAAGVLTETKIPFFKMMRKDYWLTDDGQRVKHKLKNYLKNKQE